MHHPTSRIVEHWLEQERAQCVHHEELIRRPIASVNALPRSYISLVFLMKSLNTFYLRLYGVGRIVNDYSNSERGNPLLPLHGLLFPISSKRSHICTIPVRIADTTAFYKPVVEH